MQLAALLAFSLFGFLIIGFIILAIVLTVARDLAKMRRTTSGTSPRVRP